MTATTVKDFHTVSFERDSDFPSEARFCIWAMGERQPPRWWIAETVTKDNNFYNLFLVVLRNYQFEPLNQETLNNLANSIDEFFSKNVDKHCWRRIL